MTPLHHTDVAIAELVRATAAQHDEAQALYTRAGLLEANAVLFDIINPSLAAQNRAKAEVCRETAKAISHAATLAQLEGSVR